MRIAVHVDASVGSELVVVDIEAVCSDPWAVQVNARSMANGWVPLGSMFGFLGRMTSAV